MRRHRGFTFVESAVCILVVLLLAGITYPNLIRDQEKRTHRLIKEQIRSLADAAKSRAIRVRSTVSLRFDKNTRTLQVIEEDSQGLSKPLPDLKLPDGIEAERFATDANESPSDGWRLPYFADGSTTGGGIEFKDGEDVYSLIIDSHSDTAEVVAGKLPDLSQTTWPAGGVQKRAS